LRCRAGCNWCAARATRAKPSAVSARSMPARLRRCRRADPNTGKEPVLDGLDLFHFHPVDAGYLAVLVALDVDAQGTQNLHQPTVVRYAAVRHVGLHEVLDLGRSAER